MFIMPKSCTTKRRHRQSGISMIELMIGVVIGLLTALVVANTIIASDEQRRGTVTGNDAQNNAALAAYLIERDIRMSGYGIFTNEVDGLGRVCTVGNVRTHNASRPTPQLNFDTNLPFAPAYINPPTIPAGDAGSDVLLVNYSGGDMAVSGTGVKLGQNTDTSSTSASGGFNFKINAAEFTLAGYRTGDLVMAVENGRDCSLYEITAPNSPMTGDSLTIGTSAYASDHQNGTSTTPSWNKSGGLGVNYTTAGRIYNIGAASQFVSVAYAVRNGQLTRCDLMTSTCTDNGTTQDATIWVPIASNVAALRVEMGRDTDGDRVVDTWSEHPCGDGACTPTYDQWTQVKAIRMVVVARSMQFSKEEATATVPTWQGQNAISLEHVPDWNHYRYGTVELLVPLRNVVLWSTI